MYTVKRNILTEVLEKKPPNVLYHYTTQAGLLGIIQHREIWATHTQYLNDQREYLHAVDIVQEEIHAFVERTTDSDTGETLEAMDADVEGIESMNVCVSSFSEVGDSLPQWRAYGAATSGYAIGVKGARLAELTAKLDFFLAPCIYDRSEQRALVRALVEEVVEENLERRKQPGRHMPPGGNLCAYLHRYAPILKDPSFSEEREWRVISRPLACTYERFEYRQGSSMLIPYYRFPLGDDQIPFEVAEIVIRPTPNPAQSQRSVTSFLVSQDLEQVPVRGSAVPYRNW